MTASAASPQVKSFFDPATWTVSYVVYDHTGGQCAIVDSVLDYDAKAGRTSTTSADALMAFVKEQGLSVQWILETHAHADHLSAAHYLRKHLGGRIAIGAAITHVQNVFKGIFNLEPEFHPDGSQFDHLFAPDETFTIGELSAQALAVPGHTRSHVAFHGAGHLFCGDTLFSLGCGRLFEGTPPQMLASLARLAALPPASLVCCGHEYTLANGAFASAVDPHNPALRERLQDARVMRQAGRPTLPVTLASEIATNPFLRVDTDAIRAAVSHRLGRAPADRVETFATLRQWKNDFRA